MFSDINEDVYCRNCAKIKNINLINFRTLDEIDTICEIHKLKFFGYDVRNKINFCNDCLTDGIFEDGKLTFYDDLKFSEKEMNEILEKINKIKNKIKNDEQTFQKILIKINSQNEKEEIQNIFEKNQENNKILLKIIENYLNNFILRKLNEKINNELILSFVSIDMNIVIKDQFDENNYEKNNYIKYLNNNVIIKPNELFNFLERDQYNTYTEENNYNNNNENKDEKYKYLCINNQEDISSLGEYTRTKLITNDKLVSQIILLHDSRYAISIDKTVDIVDPQTFKVDISLNGHTKPIISMIQLKENTHRLVTAGTDETIKIWRIEGKFFQDEGTLKGHSNIIFKVIQFNNDFLVSSALNEIILWKNNFPYTNLQTIKNEKNEILSLCESNNFLFCASEFKNLSYYKFINEKLTFMESFNNIKICTQNDIISINENFTVKIQSVGSSV